MNRVIKKINGIFPTAGALFLIFYGLIKREQFEKTESSCAITRFFSSIFSMVGFIIFSPFVIMNYFFHDAKVKSLKEKYLKGREYIVDQYNDKILGKSYSSGGKEYLVNDFLDPEKLIHILWDKSEFDAEISDDGYSFIKEYYGKEKDQDLLTHLESYFKV